MQVTPSRLAPSLVPVVFASMLLPAARAQAQAANAVNTAAVSKDTGKRPDVDGLPAFLKPVPAGDVWLGIPGDKFFEMAAESVSPLNPDRADPAKLERALKYTSSELGHEKRQVPAFLLGVRPVTNAWYKVYVEKTKSHPLYHWWHDGQRQDFDKHLADIKLQFPTDTTLAPLLYFERHWKELPWALKDESGKPIDSLPAVYVNWRDAVDFAIYFGMRLPTELEFTRAARGDSQNLFVWGGDKDVGDHFTNQVLKLLGLDSMRGQRLKAPGLAPATTGPFGHLDLAGQVWEFTADIGFHPLCPESFQSEWKRVLGSKQYKQWKAKDVTVHAPNPLEGAIIVKGGSYLSATDPIQLHIDARTPLGTDETFESVGFRLAKDPRPGYDTLFSLLRRGYDKSLMLPAQSLDLESQVGIERYDFGADGFPNDYHTVSFAPVDWLSNVKGKELGKLREECKEQPFLIGVLATREPLLEPKLTPGTYSLLYRERGQPKELVAAIKEGYKHVQEELKKKAKGDKAGDKTDDKAGSKDEPAPEETGAKAGAKGKQGTWTGVLAKYGLTPKDLEPKGADEKLKIIRIDGVEIPTDHSVILFAGNDTKVQTFMPLRSDSLGATTSFPSEFLLTTTKVQGAEKQHLKIRVGVPVDAKNKRRVAEFRIELTLDEPPAAANQPWRLPTQCGVFTPEKESEKPTTEKSAAGSGK
jgi:formylglycine-generating enzyme required for sulfatase activity